MSSQAGFALRGRNPDVLSCIANLSNDEIFTSPEFASQMLDTLAEAWADANDGADIWADPNTTFLDPFTKTGVFLREITSRLVQGLADQITDLEERVDHILTKQVYGIGITELTSLLARRSLYCSKDATGEHSVVKSFGTPDGSIWFERVEHTWEGATEWLHAVENGVKVKKPLDGKCHYCGARQKSLDRGSDLESHAYAFIHTDDIKARIAELFGDDMQFDVIIGNPPYQLNDGGGGTSAVPIYQLFVEQAKELDPRYLVMVIPSRWFTGGRGLDDFRDAMLADERLRSIDDWLAASDVFPGVGLKGGVCYFLWDREGQGQARVTTRFKDWESSTATRPLLEPGADVFIRFNEALPILRKVIGTETGDNTSLALPDDKRFDRLVSPRKPFGLNSTFAGTDSKKSGDVEVYRKGGKGYIARKQVTAGADLIDSWKLFVGFAAPGTGNRDTYPHRVISTPFVGEPGTISSETYLCIGPLASKAEAESALSYLCCRLTRFLVQLHKASQNTTRKVYTFVPTQDWSHRWTDEDLYERYGISAEEIAFIEKVVRPMEPAATAD